MKKFTLKNIKFIFKGQIDIKDVDIENVLVSNKYSIVKNCFKYFIGFVNNFLDDVKPLLNKFNGSVKGFEKVKYMPFMLEEKHEDIYLKNITKYRIGLSIILKKN